MRGEDADVDASNGLDDEQGGHGWPDLPIGVTYAADALQALIAGQSPEGRTTLARAYAEGQQALRDGRLPTCGQCGAGIADPVAHDRWHSTVNVILRAALGLAPIPDTLTGIDDEFGALLSSIPTRPHLTVVRDEIEAAIRLADHYRPSCPTPAACDAAEECQLQEDCPR